MPWHAIMHCQRDKNVRLEWEKRLAPRVRVMTFMPHRFAIDHNTWSDPLPLPTWHDGWCGRITGLVLPPSCVDQPAPSLKSHAWGYFVHLHYLFDCVMVSWECAVELNSINTEVDFTERHRLDWQYHQRVTSPVRSPLTMTDCLNHHECENVKAALVAALV